MIGAADAAANLLCEFNIAAKKEDKLTNIKNGKVILVKLIASSIFSESSTNPGAIKDTKTGVNNSISKIKNNNPQNNKLKISFAKVFDFDLLFTNSDVQLGTKAALNVPSANNLRKVLGIRNATKNASAKKPVPRNIAIRISLK